MLDLACSGGVPCVLLTSGSIDIAEHGVLARCDFEPALWLPDGTTVFVPAHSRHLGKSAGRRLHTADQAGRWLGHPGYVIALIDPTDLRLQTSPTVQLLIQAADFGARLFLATPRLLRVPRPLRWLSSLTLQNHSPHADEACIRGLLTLTGDRCLPNYGFKDVVELFGHGATVAVGFDFDTEIQAAIRGAVGQIDDGGEEAAQMLVIEAPECLDWNTVVEATGTFDGPCVLSETGTHTITKVTCLRQLS
ncbi:MAG: hypothetical protein KJO31_16510 [Gammaproteobacteria bacterium]|nr:hypothetical protein [Gammaproteobacteria bacterium]